MILSSDRSRLSAVQLNPKLCCILFFFVETLKQNFKNNKTRLWSGALRHLLHGGCSSGLSGLSKQDAPSDAETYWLCIHCLTQISFIAPMPYVTCPDALTLTYYICSQLADQLWLQLTNAPSNQSAAIKQYPIKFVWQPGAFHHSGDPDGSLPPTCPERCLRDGLE